MFLLSPTFWAGVWKMATVVGLTYTVKDVVDQGLIQQTPNQGPVNQQPQKKTYALFGIELGAAGPFVVSIIVAMVLVFLYALLGKKIEVKNSK
jgi:hypothetical protein